MRLLLLNNNPAVSRLIKLSAEKAGYELDEFEDYGLVPLNSYDVILVDNELYDTSALSELKETTGCDYCIYICQRGAQKPEVFNVSLEKPFLPTDFLALLEKVKNVLGSQPHLLDEEGADELEEEQGFDIDQIDELEPEKERTFMELDHLTQDANPQEDNFADEHQNFEFDNIKFEDQLLDEAVAMDEMIENGTEEKGNDTLETLSKADVEDFNFDTDTSDAFEEDEDKSLEGDETSMENNAPCVLDKDDIDEVKQLLDESDDEESDDLSFLETEKADTFEDITEEKEDTLLGFEDVKEETLDLTLDDEVLEPVLEDDLIEEAVSKEDDLVLSPSFEEYEEETSSAEDMEAMNEEMPSLLEQDAKSGIDSLDDLNETLIKKAFGEEVLETADEEGVPLSAQTKAQNEEIEVIRGEIEKSISRSISGFAQSDILREALKGMRINISISFDENEAK